MCVYYLDKHPKTKGFHELHAANCCYLPPSHKRYYLGEFYSLSRALKVAEKMFCRIEPCKNCCPH